MPTKTTRKKQQPPEPVAEHGGNDLPTRKLIATVAAWKRLAKGGKPPTTRVLAGELGVSQAAVMWRLRECEAKGLLVRPIVQRPGPLELTAEGEKWLAMAG